MHLVQGVIKILQNLSSAVLVNFVPLDRVPIRRLHYFKFMCQIIEELNDCSAVTLPEL